VAKNIRFLTLALPFLLSLTFIACSDDDDSPTGPSMMNGHDPDNAQIVAVDRFSDDAAALMKRSENPGLPAPNAPVNFDSGEPFITSGLGPDGEAVRYYNFDVQLSTPAPIYVLFREGESSPVDGQLNIVDVIPGDPGYNDFWQVHKVTVPTDYEANTVASLQEILDAGYSIEGLETIVNCPVVPDGSAASMRAGGESASLHRGWYKEMVVKYFTFEEHPLSIVGSNMVPISEILVSFNINPNQSGGGPASGFRAEMGTSQTHNVLQTLPGDASYSPLWDVDVYDNADFNQVHNWSTASASSILGTGVALVNCPVVFVGERRPVDPEFAPIVSVDRFSDQAAMLMRRSENPGLPGPDMPIDFDSGAPFITQGLSPAGTPVQYYNFDVQSTTPAPIYVLFRSGSDTPVEGQLNIIDVLPGDAGYNDFWQVNKVTVPSDYVANTITSADQIFAAGLTIEETTTVVNCPVVPDGSTADLRIMTDTNGLVSGWKDGYVVKYFVFTEAELSATGNGMVPLSDIYVCFNINPDQTGGGPGSGFKTENGTDQTHNVVETLPSHTGYSPLWDVNVYDNMDFANVMNLSDATMAMILGEGVATVNCPIVSVSN
jgi:hypothetical protein